MFDTRRLHYQCQKYSGNDFRQNSGGQNFIRLVAAPVPAAFQKAAPVGFQNEIPVHS